MGGIHRIRAAACGWFVSLWLLGPRLLMAAVPTVADYGLTDQSVDVWETAQGLPGKIPKRSGQVPWGSS